MLPLEEYYSLLHAFDRLGRRLYSDWTGDEFEQRPIDAPDVITSKRAPLEARLAEIEIEQNKLRAAIRASLDKSQNDSHEEKITGLFAERVEVQNKLMRIWKLDDASYQRQVAAHQRRSEVEKRLIAALQARELEAQFGRGLMIDWPSWSIERGFKYYLSLSLVRVARNRSAMRRATVWIRRDTFENWLRTEVSVSPAARAKMSREERCVQWLLELAQKTGGKKPAGGERAIYVDARRDIPGLAFREFHRAWLRVAPLDWRIKGAPPKRN
jgi:hypothetical protein